MDTQEIEKFTEYHHFLSKFSYNSVTVENYNVECDGNDFDGFKADITGTLSNGIQFSFKHDINGVGFFKACTHLETPIRDTEFDLEDIGMGYGQVLNAFLKTTLDFEF